MGDARNPKIRLILVPNLEGLAMLMTRNSGPQPVRMTMCSDRYINHHLEKLRNSARDSNLQDRRKPSYVIYVLKIRARHNFDRLTSHEQPAFDLRRIRWNANVAAATSHLLRQNKGAEVEMPKGWAVQRFSICHVTQTFLPQPLYTAQPAPLALSPDLVQFGALYI